MPSVSVTGAGAIEGGNATFTVVLSQPTTVQVTVVVATQAGTATEGVDFAIVNQTLVFEPGQTRQTVSVPLLQDTAIEQGETVSLRIVSVAGGLVGTGTGTAIIVDDDQPSISVTAVQNSVTEGEGSGGGTASFRISLSQPPIGPVTFSYRTVDGTATAGSDFTATTGTITLAAGEMERTVTVAVTGDTQIEANERFTLELFDISGVGPGLLRADVVITNDDFPTVILEPPELRVVEGNGPGRVAVFTVRLSAPSLQAATVDYTISPGTAQEGADFQGQGGRLLFNAGEIERVITVPIVGDGLIEPDETVLIRLGEMTGATPGVRTQATLIIANDDLPTLMVQPEIRFVEGPGPGVNGTATVVLRLSAPSFSPVTLNFATVPGTATENTDYVGRTGTVTFAPGQVEQTIVLQITGDNSIELDETFSLRFTDVTGAFVPQDRVNLLIVNDDLPVVSLDPAPVRVTEGEGGSRMATVTVRLDRAGLIPVEVGFRTEPGTATPGSDFTPVTGLLRFAPGQTEQTIAVPILGDAGIEPDETITVVLTPPVGAVLGNGSSTVIIVNDDQPTVTVNAAVNRITEGNTAGPGGTTASFTVRLSAAALQPVSVDFRVEAGTATAGSDFIASIGTLTFAPGQTEQTVTVPVIGDSVPELDETFSLVLLAPVGVVLTPGPGSTATVTIVNDDRPVITLDPATIRVTEGSAATGPNAPPASVATVTVRLSVASPTPVTVAFAAESQSAQSGSDFTAASGVLTFNPGQLTQTITVPITGDGDIEPDETFIIRLSQPTGAELGPETAAVVTIVNDDLPVVGVDPAPLRITEGNSGTTPVQVTVRLSAASSTPVTVDYVTEAQSATPGADFVNATGTLTFAPGQTSQTVTLQIAGDTVNEGDETFQLRLTTASGATLGPAVIGVVTIVNDDTNVQIGGSGADTLIGSASADTISGGGGNDVIDGLAGDDQLVGGTGADTVSGGDGNDFYQIGSGEWVAGDTINDSGGTNDQIILTSPGLIDLSVANFSGIENIGLFNSGVGSILVLSATQLASISSLSGAGGTADEFRVAAPGPISLAHLSGGGPLTGAEVIRFAGTGTGTQLAATAMQLGSSGLGAPTTTFADLGGSNDMVSVMTTGALTFNPVLTGGLIERFNFVGSGNGTQLTISQTTLASIAAFDNLGGTADSITFNGGTGITFTIPTGLEFVRLQTVGAHNINGSSGNDRVGITWADLNSMTDLISLGGGSDALEITDAVSGTNLGLASFSGIEELRLLFNGSTAQNLTLTATTQSSGLTRVDASSATGSVSIDVSAFSTTGMQISGGTGSDTLLGGGGNDTLIGGTGADSMVGGAGADVYRYDSLSAGAQVAGNVTAASAGVAVDTIAGFVSSVDRIQLSPGAFSSSAVFVNIGTFTYDGTNSGRTGGAAVIRDATGTLYYDPDVSTPGYTVIANLGTATVTSADVTIN